MTTHRAWFAAALLGLLPAAQAAPVVDQSFTGGPQQIGAVIGTLPGIFDLKVFQGFTVGLSGRLTSVDFFLETDGNPTASLVVDIVSSADLLGAALASTTVGPGAIGASPAFVNFDFSAANLNVHVGDTLAIRLSSAQDFTGNVNQYVARGLDAGGYAGGSGRHWFSTFGVNNTTWDFYFRTYVDTSTSPVPAPATTVLVLSALAAMALVRRRAAR